MRSTLLLLSLLALAACGEPGNATDGGTPHDGAVRDAGPHAWPDSGPIVTPPDAGPVAPPPTPVGSTVTTVVLEEQSGAARTNVPITFAMPFRAGDVPAGDYVVARAGGVGLATQLDGKTTHADGSLRHALITVVVPSLGAHESKTVELVASTTPGAAGAPLDAASLTAAGFDASVALASPSGTVVASFAPSSDTWMQGPIATEWTSVADATVDGRPLSVRFDVRWYGGRARVGVTVENDWAFEPGPTNVTYDASVRVGGAEVGALAGVTHYALARWHHVYWWGEPIDVHVRHDAAYVISTGAVAAYDTSLVIPEDAIASLRGEWDGTDQRPMSAGLVSEYMPMTGGRREIGPLPSWDVQYLLSGDARLWPVVEGSADLAGSWPIHYRERATGRIPTIDDHPNITIGDPGTSGAEAFPSCGGTCDTPMTPDSAHQPSLAYLAYLLGGDRYDLDELHFWADYNMLQANPEYRGNTQGLVKWEQVRGQAWSLRTLAYAAWVTPDADPLHAYFADKVEQNVAWYTAHEVHGADANPLGVLESGYAFVYGDETKVSPWQDDFFTWVTVQLVAMGHADATELATYKSQFVVGRMTAPCCWIFAAMYEMVVRPTTTSTELYTWDELATVNADPATAGTACGSHEMAVALGKRDGEMTGYADSNEGYPSNMQPGLAAAAELGAPGAAAAWATFAARAVQPDYGPEPQFAIVPTRFAH